MRSRLDSTLARDLKIVPLTDDGQAPNHRAHNLKNYYYYMIYVIFFIGLDKPSKETKSNRHNDEGSR